MVEYYDLLKKSGVSLERLATLCRVVDQGGISKAAGGEISKLSLYSRQIKQLEEALGVRLKERVGRVAVLTPAAKCLAAIARGHFKELSSFAAEEGKLPATVTLGASNSLLEWVVLPRLPALTRGLRKETILRLLTYRTGDLVEALLDRRCDMGLVRATAVRRGLKTRHAMKFGYALFVPEALVRKPDAVRILATVPLATSIGGDFRRQLELAAGSSKIKLNVGLECPSFGLAARAVYGGVYAAILPEIAAASFNDRPVRLLPLPFKMEPSREILLASHSHADEKLVNAVGQALCSCPSVSSRR
jgi:DNA-binding transcriptional LysR family regulator